MSERQADVLLGKIRELSAKRDDPKQNIWVDNSYSLEAHELFDELDALLSRGGDYPKAWQG